MKRNQRTKILINSEIELAKGLATEIIEGYKVKIIEEPNNGLIMTKVRESAKNSLFYLGEVFISECKVQVGDALGLGIVTGDRPELAYYLAVVDGAYNGNLPETMGWSGALKEANQRYIDRIQNKNSKILKTKVNFETMDV